MDGIARHTPEGIMFKKRSEEVGFKQAVLVSIDHTCSSLPPTNLLNYKERDGGAMIPDHRPGNSAGNGIPSRL